MLDCTPHPLPLLMLTCVCVPFPPEYTFSLFCFCLNKPIQKLNITGDDALIRAKGAQAMVKAQNIHCTIVQENALQSRYARGREAERQRGLDA